MPTGADTFGRVQKNATKTLMARLVNKDADLLTQAQFSSGSSSSDGQCDEPVAYSIYLLDDQDPDSRTVVDGHDDVALYASDVIFDSLQTDDLWVDDDGNAIDATGYNFRHTIDICPDNAFALAGRNYLVEYRLQPLAGEVILVRFRLNCI